jgi:hypothetical protein
MTQFGTLTPNGVIDEMEIDLSKVKSDDPIAYSYGFFQGKSGKEMDNSDDLAKEYVRGYSDGRDHYIQAR